MNHDKLIISIDKFFPDKNNAILVSACLLGINCTYDNSNNKNEFVLLLSDYRELIPICPEQLSGLPTPRDPQSIVNGTGKDVLNGKTSIMTVKEIDVTANFLKGVSEIEKIVNLYQIKYAILKEKSPSCGVKQIYNNDNLVAGQGVTTAYLESNNITVYSEKDIEKLLSFKSVDD
ncbi:MAG: DUF523 domain-containing protein [Asgard group archaeon]|nr:DUF523 domain-containing protein [Asgard group archaeon]